jgi:hypothetical protein
MHFDRLRREYPVRHEFRHFSVPASGVDSGVAATCRGLGFRII